MSNTTSYVAGTATFPCSKTRSARCWTGRCRVGLGARRWYRWTGVRWTYEEFGRRVDELARGLMSLGLERGDRVGVWAPNCAEWTLTQFATAKAGLIQVNVNPAYRLSELEYTLTKVGVKALVAAASFKTSDYVAMIETLAPELPHSSPRRTRSEAAAGARDRGEDRRRAPSGMARVRRPRQKADPSNPAVLPVLSNRDPISIQYTSGTTGLPKGARPSHHNILNNAFFVGEHGMRHADRLCVPVPLYHCFGMVMSNLACVVHGATIVYPAAGFDPLAVLAASKRSAAPRCTACRRCSSRSSSTRGSASSISPRCGRGSWRARPARSKSCARYRPHAHAEMTIAYGMTETSPVSFQSSPGDPLERRVTTVGRIQPHMEAKASISRAALCPAAQSVSSARAATR